MPQVWPRRFGRFVFGKMGLCQLVPASVLICVLIFVLVFALLMGVGMVASASNLEGGVSTLSHNFNGTTNQATGQKSLWGTQYYDFFIGANLPFLGTTSFAPSLHYMPTFILPYRTPDNQTNITYLLLRLPVLFPLTQDFAFTAGLDYLDVFLAGSGALVTQSNGTSSKQFATPGVIRDARTYALDVGLDYNFNPIRVSLATILESAASNSRRNFSLFLSLGYNFYGF